MSNCDKAMYLCYKAHNDEELRALNKILPAVVRRAL